MTTMQLEPAPPRRVPARTAVRPAVRPDVVDGDPYASARAELAQYRAEMCELGSMEPRDVFMHLSSWHARAAVIRASTYESESRRASAFRSHEVDPFLDACDFQFRLWSRIQATTETEVRLTRGGV